MAVSSPVTKALMAAVTAAAVVWLVIVLAWTDAPFALTFDDAWYYFAIGRNLATGHGSTFDGLNPTNGYHPLWMLVCTIVFRTGIDGLAAARALLALQVLCYAGALATVAQIVGSYTDGWPSTKDRRPRTVRTASLLIAAAFALVAANPFVVKSFVNGLEPGVGVLVVALLLWYGSRIDGRWLAATTPRQRRALSVLLTLAFLARTDAAFLLACIAIACVIEWLRTTPRPVMPMIELFLAPTVVVVAYMAYNHRKYGSVVQISGLVKRADLAPVNLAVFGVFVVVAGLVQRHGDARLAERRPARRGRFPRTAQFVLHTAWYAAFCLLLLGYYLTLQTQVWLWYFAPIVLYGIVLLPLAAADFAEEALRTAPAAAPAQRALLPVWLVLGVPLLIAFVVTGTQFADPDLRSIQIANADTGEWMAANTGPTDVFASWDAGAIGYFSGRSVINLDGVVNSHRYYDARREGAAAVRRFLSCERLRFVVNHGADVGGEDPDIRRFIEQVYGPEIAAASRVVYTRPFSYSGVIAGDDGFDAAPTARAVHVYELPVAALTPPGPCP